MSSWGTRTVPRVCGSERVKGGNVATAAPSGSSRTVRSWISCPSSSNVIGTSRGASPPWRAMRTVGVTRSRPATACRTSETPATCTFSDTSSWTATGVTTVPAGRCTPSSPVQPLRWKSEMSTTSPRGSSDSSRMVCATLRAGPYRVVPEPTTAVSTAASRRPGSDVERAATLAP